MTAIHNLDSLLSEPPGELPESQRKKENQSRYIPFNAGKKQFTTSLGGANSLVLNLRVYFISISISISISIYIYISPHQIAFNRVMNFIKK